MSGNGGFCTSLSSGNINKTGGIGRVPKSSLSMRMNHFFKSDT